MPYESELRADGALVDAFQSILANDLTGLGTPGADKYLGSRIAHARVLTRFEIMAIYRGSKICQKVVDLLPQSATGKSWLEVTIGKGRKGIPAKAMQYADDLKFRSKLREACQNGRLDGDGFVVLGIDDGRTPDQPVDESNIRQISWVEPLTRWQLTPASNTGRPGHPEYYRYALSRQEALPQTGSNQPMTFGKIHASRVLRLPGKKLVGDLTQYNEGYNDSVLLAFYQSFLKYLTVTEYSARMVQDYDTFIYKLDKLATLVLNNQGDKVRDRMRTLLLGKSILGGMALDKMTEDAAYISRNYSGLDTLIEAMKNDTSAAAGMPPSKLWGTSNRNGLGTTTGEADKYEWADCVEEWQTETIDQPCEDFFRLVFLAKNGPTGGRVPDSWGLKYKSVLRLSLKEQVTLRKEQTTGVDIPSIAKGILTVEEVRESAWGGEAYSIERQLLGPTPQPQPTQQPQLPATITVPTQPQAIAQAAQIANSRQDDATPAKRIVDWQEFKLGLQYLPFERRHGRTLPVAYGHIRGTKGADGMSLDCYVNPMGLGSPQVFAIKQMINGKFDEEKLMIGFGDRDQAEATYKAVMPPEFFGGIRELTIAELEGYKTNG